MILNIDLPPEVEAVVRREYADAGNAARESLGVYLYRRGLISHTELSRTLGLGRLQTESVLARHGVTEDTLTADEIETDRRTLDRLLGPLP